MTFREHDPLKCLPYELWVECIYTAISGEPTGPLSILEVSVTWTKSILAAPQLWSTIYIDNGHDQLARGETFLSLSQPGSINLIIDADDSVSLHTLERILHICPQRIMGLFFGESVNPNVIMPIISTAASQGLTQGFINIRNVEIHPKTEEWSSFYWFIIANCPQLRRLTNISMHVSDFDILPKSLEIISLYETSDEQWPLLDYGTYRIQDMAIEFSPPQGGTAHTGASFFPHLPLQKLSIAWGTGVSMVPEGLVINPRYNLRELVIAIPWYDISLLLPHLNSWPSLNFLSLDLDSGAVAPVGWMEPHIDMRYIVHLNITSETFSGAHQNFERVIRLFVRRSPLHRLRQMKLHARGREFSRALVSGLLRSLTSLNNLDILLPQLYGSAVSSISMPNLIELLVGSLDILQLIEAPNLLHLRTTFQAPYYRIPYSPIVLSSSIRSLVVSPTLFWKHVRQHDHWLNLRKVQWISDYGSEPISLNPQLMLLSTLEEVSFAKPKRMRDSQAKVIPTADALNPFLQELYYNPTACPRLHTITSTSYPSWYLLLSFLDQRKKGIDANPIQVIRLPAYPQIAILSALVSCLNTTYPDDPSTAQAYDGIDAIIQARLELSSL